ncbi:hypothetical protein BX666DRAFT_2028148 [Dichotomocladium elegans]|nr:hypothetical protein BX666DRAFT_2028148 [Dichotomocladium elegans]
MVPDLSEAYDGSEIQVHIAIWAVLLMLLGIFLMSVSFQFFIVSIGVVGFYIGASITWILLTYAEPLKERYPHATVLFTCVSIAGGLVFAGVTVVFWCKSMYLISTAAGYILSLFLWSWKPDYIILNAYARNFAGLGVSLAFGLSMLVIEFLAVCTSTALIGAYTFAIGLDLILRTGLVNGPRSLFDLRSHNIAYNVSDKIYAMLAGVIVLWLLSTILQLVLNRGKRFGVNVVKKEIDDL